MVGGTVLISMPVALVLQQDFYGRGVARTIVMLPWSVSLAMAAIVWRWAFNADYGMINATLRQLGLIAAPCIGWRGRRPRFRSKSASASWCRSRSRSTILLGGLSSIPSDIYEAARIDGARAWQQFRHLTLPLLRPFVNIADRAERDPRVQLVSDHLGDDAGRAGQRHAYSGDLLYELAFRLGRPGPAAAVSLVMLAIVFAFTGIYLRLRREEA